MNNTLTLKEFEESFNEETFQCILKTWPGIQHVKEFDSGIHDLYSTVGKDTPQGVKECYYQISKYVNTLMFDNDRSCSTSAYYYAKKDELHLLVWAGSNGIEGSIRRSLKYSIKVIDELNKLGYKHYMTDVNIDNCDDVYGFYFVIKDVSGIQNTK